MPRKALGDRPMTPAERQKRTRMKRVGTFDHVYAERNALREAVARQNDEINKLRLALGLAAAPVE